LDYVRAEFLRNRRRGHVRDGAGDGFIECPDHLASHPAEQSTPVITFLPFRMSGATLRCRASTFSASACHRLRLRLGECSRKTRRISTRLVDLAVTPVGVLVRPFAADIMGDGCVTRFDTRNLRCVKAGGGK